MRKVIAVIAESVFGARICLAARGILILYVRELVQQNVIQLGAGERGYVHIFHANYYDVAVQRYGNAVARIEKLNGVVAPRFFCRVMRGIVQQRICGREKLERCGRHVDRLFHYMEKHVDKRI